jgi:hypothetical protein
MRHSATINNIDAKLLLEQKYDLLKVIRFIEECSENYPEFNTETWIASLDGLLNMLDDISDKIEKE